MTISFGGTFLSDAIWMLAHAQLTAVDRAAVPEDARWKLWEEPDGDTLVSVQDGLATPLLMKLGNVPDTQVVVYGSFGSKPGGGTCLSGFTASGTEEDLTHATADEVRAWRETHPTGRFAIKVKVTADAELDWPGCLVEILVHELAAHAEPFADFLLAEDFVRGSGDLESEAEQHRRLHTGNPRYRLLGACYLEQFPEEGNGPEFCARMLMDTQAEPTLPPGLWLTAARLTARPEETA
ncbi:hypothetical protein ABZY31_05480 [Streptomyces sp. NPDC006529]|uniref:hypothetical protein n=1 Tax=Streptomyces sp. NPDC006529 TaxID=3157177 RepID=UPI0033BF4955